MSCTIPKGCIYGLVGANGAGKSTFLRILTGVYKPDGGTATIDGEPVYDNPRVKARLAFVADELYFLPQSSMERMAGFYAANYSAFDRGKFGSLTGMFKLDPKANLNQFSKGMRRQAALILALSTKPDYLFMDETFDGLDPVMRNLVKNIIYADICERNATAVITSHSLRELEDTCDQLALLYDGGIIFESDVDNLKTSLLKAQIVFSREDDKEVLKDAEVLDLKEQGSVVNVIIRGDKQEFSNKINALAPPLFEMIPLTLEEVFIHEMEALGYAFDDALGMQRGDEQ
ncbi:MAG: ABC transporter ATP-binding protein [Coriobacteriia bacterium]|nr:ABC transporter ATP-binding protein [Coriobacteriia bacterium]